MSDKKIDKSIYLFWKIVLPFLYIGVLLHTVKDFFQDFLEWDVLTFADANENLWILPKWGRWLLALANETAVWVGLALVILTPFVFTPLDAPFLTGLKRRRPILEPFLVAGYLFFLLVLGTDLLLDPRIVNPQLFFDPTTRIPAPEIKQAYREILRVGPF